MSIYFGHKDRFAIECQLDDTPTRFFNCSICLWATNQPIGDYERGASLVVSANFFSSTLDYSGRRADKDMEGKTPRQVLDCVDAALYDLSDEDTPLEEVDRNWQKYHPLVICPGGGPAFDGWLAVLLEEAHGQRFIWLKDDGPAGEIYLLPAEYEKVVQQFLDWSNSVIR